ncbi:hypothetical protein L9F63_020696, partial [Diploptera punctata]
SSESCFVRVLFYICYYYATDLVCFCIVKVTSCKFILIISMELIEVNSKAWGKFYSSSFFLFNTNIAEGQKGDWQYFKDKVNSCFMIPKERTTVEDKLTNFVKEF